MTSAPTPATPEELILLGAAIYQAQKVEWALYGIAAHASHLPVAQRERRFKQLTPESFLRGNLAALKATLGQIASRFGEAFLISNPALERFVADRNLIVHDFYRLFHAKVRDAQHRDDPIEFLNDFCRRCEHWLAIILGLLVVLRERAAEKEGRTDELVLTDKDQINKAAYLTHANEVAKRLLSESGGHVASGETE